MTAPLRERLEAGVPCCRYHSGGEARGLKWYSSVNYCEICQVRLEALAELAEREKDAERYRWLQLRMRGERFASGRQYFDIDFPDPLTNIMQGSVAEHFNDAIDAAIKEGK